MKRTLLHILAVVIVTCFGVQFVRSQTIYTFTNCGATGLNGPTQAQANSAYSATNLNGQVTVTSGIQYWQVPGSGDYIIEAIGAKGGGVNGGKGARMIGEFSLTQGQTLKILVGQQGEALLSGRYDYSGGGGSFVADNSNNPLIVAGGGGGANASSSTSDGSTGTSGMNGGGGHSNGSGGSSGQGGTGSNQTSDGGAGFLTNGYSGNPNPAPQAFVNGGSGGCNTWSSGTCAHGGFGGGGGTNRLSTTYWACGGGGGYSGGGAAYGRATNPPYAGGGGSINNGTNQSNTAGYGTGHGTVIITQLTKPINDVGVDYLLGLDTVKCPGDYPVVAVVRNYGANQVSSVTVEWTINGNPQPDTTVNALMDTAKGSGPDSLIVPIGIATVSAVTDLNVWTSMPNNKVDSFGSNDTVKFSIPPPVYIATAKIFDSIVCPGDSNGVIRITIKGGDAPYSIAWSNGLMNSTSNSFIKAGTYTAVVTDKNGCQDSATIVLPEPPSMTITANITRVSVSGGQDGVIDLSVSGGKPLYSYLWSNGKTTQDIFGLAQGTYSVVVTDATPCSDSMSFGVFTVGINEVMNSLQFNIFPNPASQTINISFFGKSSGDIQLELLDITGKTVRSIDNGQIDSDHMSMDVSDLQEGLYFYRIRTQGGYSTIRKVTIKH